MTFRIHAAHAYSLLMFTTLFALAGCGGDSGGTTVTPLGEPQTPYTPKFASESLVLNLKIIGTLMSNVLKIQVDLFLLFMMKKWRDSFPL